VGQVQENEWIEWTGGECPVAPEQRVDVRLRNRGDMLGHRAGAVAVFFQWDRLAANAANDVVAYRYVSAPNASTPNTPPASNDFALVPREPTEAMLQAAARSVAHDDEGSFPPVCDLIDYSGENKTRTVLRQLLIDALAAAPASPEPASNEAPGRGGVTLYREIDALGGEPQSASEYDRIWNDGYSAALTAALSILERRGFSEHVEAVPATGLVDALEALLDAYPVFDHTASDQIDAREAAHRAIATARGEA
jgi:hypothetical protein